MAGRRGVRGAKRPDSNQMRAWMSSQELTTALGVVRKFPGEESHFEIDTENGTNEVLVDVELIPSGTKVLCRLGFGNDGVYRIPREGSEVAVLIPFDSSSLIKDSLDFGPIIVGVLNNNAPDQLDDDDIVVIEATRVHVIATDVHLQSSNILLGTNPNPLDGVVVGTGIDSFTGATYAVLGSTSQKVKAEK